MQTLQQSLSEISPDVRVKRRGERGEIVVELRCNVRNGFWGMCAWGLPNHPHERFEQFDNGLARMAATARFEEAKRELELTEVSIA